MGKTQTIDKEAYLKRLDELSDEELLNIDLEEYRSIVYGDSAASFAVTGVVKFFIYLAIPFLLLICLIVGKKPDKGNFDNRRKSPE